MVFENATYNMTALHNASNVYDLVVYANDSTGQILVGLFVIAVFFIMFVGLKRNAEFAESLLASSFICFVISGFFTYGKLLNMIFPLIFLAITAFTILFMQMSKK